MLLVQLRTFAVGSVLDNAKIAAAHLCPGAMMLDIKTSADYLSRSTGSFSNFSMLFAGEFRNIAKYNK